MQDSTIQWFDCPHCEGRGLCLLANEKSCGTCIQDAKLKATAEVVRCGVCEGMGKVEPKTMRLNSRMPFMIVMVVLVIFYLYVLSNLIDGENFDQIFPLISALTTMIVTFYFSRK